MCFPLWKKSTQTNKQIKLQEKQIKGSRTWVKVLQNHQSVNMVPNSHFHRHKTPQLFRNRYSNLHISSVELCFWHFNTDIYDAKRNNKNSGFIHQFLNKQRMMIMLNILSGPSYRERRQNRTRSAVVNFVFVTEESWIRITKRNAKL